ncbi:MAG: hypothetical protein H6816_14675 [Phycisphaerales bacterium]|nr:hypothetical protein [Phycisphaerales bacterium]
MMSDKQANLDSLRRVAQRLREIGDDAFAENLAARLEAEIAAVGAPATREADNDTTPDLGAAI